MQFGVEMIDDNVAAANLTGYIARATVVLETAGELIRQDFQAISARRFGAHGPGWAPLTDTTVRIKARRRMPQPETPMYGTGKLMFSLAGENEFTVYQVSADAIVMGTSAPYARYHQIGPRTIRVFGRGSATLPQRKVVDITQADAARWVAILSAVMRGEM